MPNPVAAIIGSGVVGGVAQAGAAKSAAGSQSAAAAAGIEEQRRQFDKARELLQPYVEAGTEAMGGLTPFMEAGQTAFQQQLALAGVSGSEAQQKAIAALEQGPEFAALTQAGEEAILQQASATGGIRGGRTQAALAQFRPQVISHLINQQYGRLGGISATGLGVTEGIVGRGQSAAAGVGQAGMTTGANVANLLAQQGAAQAGGALGVGQAFGNFAGGMGNIFGTMSTGAIPSWFGSGTTTNASGAVASSPRPRSRPF